jgi:hypothetical protein
MKLRAAVFGVWVLLSCFAGMAKESLIIHYGWVQPALEELKAHVAEMEAEAPFDGLVFQMGVTDVMGKNEMKMNDEIKDRIKLYRQVKFKKYVHNFAMVMADQSKPDWHDDKYWKGVAHNFGLAAEVVAKAGMEGLCFDPEGYGVYPVNSYWTTKYWLEQEAKADWKGAKHAKEEYLAAAKKRGAEVGKAMFAKNGKLKFWGLYLWSMGADLMGEFCNGLIEAMPSGASLIDGDEWLGYCANGEAAYKNLVKRMKGGCGFLDSKLRAKHLKQDNVAIAFYMDFYTDVKSPLFDGNAKAFKDAGKKLKSNLKEAKRAAGGYVWVYGEKGQWWDMTKYKGRNKFEMWDVRVPGAADAVFMGKQAKEKKK